jgi:hypothetical protein
MNPNPSMGLVTLPEVVKGELTGKFGEISLYNHHADFELGSDSNSNSTSPWAIACEPAIEPSCADSPLHEHFPYGLLHVVAPPGTTTVVQRVGFPSAEIRFVSSLDLPTASLSPSPSRKTSPGFYIGNEGLPVGCAPDGPAKLLGRFLT